MAIQVHNVVEYTHLTSVSNYVDHNKLWKTLQEMGIPDHLVLSPKKPVRRSRINS